MFQLKKASRVNSLHDKTLNQYPIINAHANIDPCHLPDAGRTAVFREHKKM